MFLLPTILYGQDSTLAKGRRFFISESFSPDYCYRYITKNDKSITSDQWTKIKNIEDSIYTPSFGYSAGLNFYYQINRLISIETGIQYSRRGYQTIPLPTIYNFDYDPAIATSYIYFTYLDFPLRVNYTFLKSKFQIIASTGVVFNYLQQVSYKTVPENPTSIFPIQIRVSQYPYNKINYSPIVSLGLKYNISNRINLRAEPIFRYGLLNTDSKSYAFTHLWTAGLNLSLNFGL